MRKEEDRKLCIKKDFHTPRDERRIPIICNAIYELWTKYRENNPKIGFFYITNLLEVESDRDHKGGDSDPFYWEDEKWYDKIYDLIDNASDFKFNRENTSKENAEMSQILKYFQNYWLLYSDLRLKQIINIFDDMFQEKIREYETTNLDFWKGIFIPEQISSLENSIKHLEETKQEISSGADSLLNNGLRGENVKDLENIYVTKLNKLIEKSQKRLDELKKEYEIE